MRHLYQDVHRKRKLFENFLFFNKLLEIRKKRQIHSKITILMGIDEFMLFLKIFEPMRIVE